MRWKQRVARDATSLPSVQRVEKQDLIILENKDSHHRWMRENPARQEGAQITGMTLARAPETLSSKKRPDPRSRSNGGGDPTREGAPDSQVPEETRGHGEADRAVPRRGVPHPHSDPLHLPVQRLGYCRRSPGHPEGHLGDPGGNPRGRRGLLLQVRAGGAGLDEELELLPVLLDHYRAVFLLHVLEGVEDLDGVPYHLGDR